jgi:hypothetical protein
LVALLHGNKTWFITSREEKQQGSENKALRETVVSKKTQTEENLRYHLMIIL